jgi:hypothetical protein
MFEQTTQPYEGPERRRAERSPAALPITVRPAGRRQLPAMLDSISPFGGTATGITLGAAEGTMWVRLPGLESQPARCVWRSYGAAGFAFDHPLHPAVARRFCLQQTPTYQAPAVKPQQVLHNAEAPASRREQIRVGHAQPPERLLRAKPHKESNAELMRMVRRRMARVVDQRLVARFSPPSRATLGFRLAGQPATLRDLSPSGLKAAADIAGPIGTEVAIAFAGFPEIAGRIVWIREGAAGIRLPDNALDLFEAA